MIHLVTDHAHDAPDPADPTAGLRCPTCGRAPRLTCTPPETHPPIDAEAELTCCRHYAHAAGATAVSAAEDAAGRWLRLFPVDDARGDVDREPMP
jgi:hypothetical protein